MHHPILIIRLIDEIGTNTLAMRTVTLECAIYRVPCLARHSTRDAADVLPDDICTPLSTGNVRIVYVSRAGESILRDLVTVRWGFALTVAEGSVDQNSPMNI